MTKTCVICLTPFEPTGPGKHNVKVCGDACRQEMHRRNSREYERRIASGEQVKERRYHCKEKAEPKKRRCLKCDHSFETVENYRLCLTCRTYADKYDGYGNGAIA